jgi:hypothetical protein
MIAPSTLYVVQVAASLERLAAAVDSRISG